MEAPDLPPELRKVERLLSACGGARPPADLRARVLAAVRRELAAQASGAAATSAAPAPAGTAAASASAAAAPAGTAAATQAAPPAGGPATPSAGPWWRRPGLWQYAAAAAAGVLLLLNLAMSAAMRGQFAPPRTGNGADIEQAAARIADLVPSMTRDEAVREAIALRAASRLALTPLPRPDVLRDGLLRQLKESAPWLTQ